jgi:60 kDa SS-A/Ro ribonucleoprotein
VSSQPHDGAELGRALRGLRNAYDRIVVITDEQSQDRVPAPHGRGFVVNVASARNGVGMASGRISMAGVKQGVDYLRRPEGEADADY